MEKYLATQEIKDENSSDTDLPEDLTELEDVDYTDLLNAVNNDQIPSEIAAEKKRG